MADRWALAVTRSEAELPVAAELAHRSFAHHLFMARKKAVVRGQVISCLRPAFPRYVFVDPEDRWRSVLEVPGVVSFVRFGDNPQPELISDRVVQNLCDRAHLDIFPGESPVSERFGQGDPIRIVGDNVAHGYRGVYQHSLGYPQSLILVDWMGRMVPVSVDERDLEKWEPRKSRRRRRRRRANRGRPSSTHTNRIAVN